MTFNHIEMAAYIVIAAILFLAAAMHESRRRFELSDSIKRLAKEQDFAFYVGELPDVPRELLRPLAVLMLIESAVVGKRFGEEVVAFTYRKGWRRNQRVLLAFAVKQKFPGEVRVKGFEQVRRSGDWTLLNLTGFFSTVMTPQEMVQVWDRMRTTPEGTEEFYSDATVIRPRHEIPL